MMITIIMVKKTCLSYKLHSHTPPIKHVFHFTDAKMFTWHCYINIKMSLKNT